MTAEADLLEGYDEVRDLEIKIHYQLHRKAQSNIFFSICDERGMLGINEK